MTIKVKYIGKRPWVICPYNGKKFVFRRKNPISEIPIEVFQYFCTILEFKGMLVPVVEEKVKEVIQEKICYTEPKVEDKRKALRPKKGE